MSLFRQWGYSSFDIVENWIYFVIQADSDDLDATKAMLKGLKKHFEVTGKPAILIHTVEPCLSFFDYTSVLNFILSSSLAPVNEFCTNNTSQLFSINVFH
jgi:hypothetical protein